MAGAAIKVHFDAAEASPHLYSDSHEPRHAHYVLYEADDTRVVVKGTNDEVLSFAARIIQAVGDRIALEELDHAGDILGDRPVLGTDDIPRSGYLGRGTAS